MKLNSKIGILAIQGDYEAHAQMLERLGVTARKRCALGIVQASQGAA